MTLGADRWLRLDRREMLVRAWKETGGDPKQLAKRLSVSDETFRTIILPWFERALEEDARSRDV
jgi:hypothetical protein